MTELTLREIASFCGAEESFSGSIKTITTDSREADENSLFIPLKGERFDGHDFIPEVLAHHSAVLSEKKLDAASPDDRILYVKDTGKAFLDIASGYRDKFNIPVAALTGSVGKTTTKGMIYSVLSRKFNTLRTEGNLNNEIGVPKTLLRLSNEHTAAVIEMGMNHFGEISRIASAVKPTVGIITNIGTAHIENLGSREGILNAKCEILDGMKKGAPLILNFDNDLLSELKLTDYKIYGFGIENKNADIYAENLVAGVEGTRFDCVYGQRRESCFVPAVGIHNVYNALCAVLVGILCGMELKEAVSGVADFVPEGMRQKVKKVHGVTVIEDCYNANPDSMRASIDTLNSIKTGRALAILGDMLELGDYSEKAHREIGEFAAKSGTDLVLTVGEAAGYISRNATENGCEANHFSSKQQLTQELLKIIKPGDTLLFKGSRSMQMEDIFFELYKEWEV